MEKTLRGASSTYFSIQHSSPIVRIFGYFTGVLLVVALVAATAVLFVENNHRVLVLRAIQAKWIQYKTYLPWNDSLRALAVIPAPHVDPNILRSNPLEFFPSAPQMSDKERIAGLERSDALSDPLNRISPEFKVPSILRRRTQFWFDIYTKYGRYDHVIHHVRYPWIIYKVVRGDDIVNSGRGPLWLRRQRVEQLAQKERYKIRTALRRLANKKSYRKLSRLERQLYRQLRGVSGSRRSVFRFAAENLRSQLGQKDFFENGLRNSAKYLPFMEEEFHAQGLPTELARMPFVESSFNENAESKVGASGVWQIMPRTGRAYMQVGEYIDERNSPLKATKVAARLLKQYYRALDTWPLAITSYNHGIGNIRTAIRKAGSKDLGTIITRYHDGHFKFASSNFYTCFLAALHAEKYQDVIFPHTSKEPLLEHEELQLGYKMRPSAIAKTVGLDKDILLKFNLDIKDALQKDTPLPKGFRIYLPPGFSKELSERLGDNALIKRSRAS